MVFMPGNILGMWIRGMSSAAALGTGVYLLRQWRRHRSVHEENRRARRLTERHRARPPEACPAPVDVRRPGRIPETPYLISGLGLVLLTFAGKALGAPLWRRRAADDPRAVRAGRVQCLPRPDGTELHVETYGPPDAPALILTHGWGVDRTEWSSLTRGLADRFQLITWDLPGLGHSTPSASQDYSLEKMARDMAAVITVAGERPVVLVGHSIGGMIILTFCRLFPELVGRQVRGLVLVHTTYTNPVRTMAKRGLYTALQKPVLEPLLHLTIWLSPLVWLMNCLSYLNGSAHVSTARQSFAGAETWEQLDFVARFLLRDSPAVLARGMLGMLRYDAAATLRKIGAPVLVVSGDRDPLTAPDASERMRAILPAAHLVILAPAKHQGLLERHGEFSDAVGRFCAACLGGQER